MRRSDTTESAHTSLSLVDIFNTAVPNPVAPAANLALITPGMKRPPVNRSRSEGVLRTAGRAQQQQSPAMQQP